MNDWGKKTLQYKRVIYVCTARKFSIRTLHRLLKT